MLSEKHLEPEPDSSAGEFDAAVVLNLIEYELSFKRVYDKLFDSANLADSKIVVELINNERNPLEFYAPGVIIYNRPVIQEQLFTLDRRGKPQIKKHCWPKQISQVIEG